MPNETETRVAAALGEVATLFGAVCADPDNAATASNADAALRELDEALKPPS